MLTVGLLGATGYMGAPLCAALLNAAKKGQLDFTILHRPTSNVSKLPAEAKKRPVDFDGGVDGVRRALAGLQVIISAISWRAIPSQYILLEALRGSTDLVTFFPTEWATPYRAEDLESPFLRGGDEQKEAVVAKAKELGVPVTVVKNATTPHIMFSLPGFTVYKIKENNLELYSPLGRGTRGMTSPAFSGQAVVHLLLNRLHDLPNHTFSIVEIDWSAQDLIDVFTRVNGTPPSVNEYTEEDYQRDLHDRGFFDAMRAGRNKGLAIGCTWPGEKIQDFPGWHKRTLEDYVRDAM